MGEIEKTKEQPKGKLMPKRQRITELEKLNAEHEQAEKVLRKSEGQFRDLLEDANDLIQSVAPDSHFLYVNRTWQKVLGYSNEDISNLTLWDIIHPDSRYHCREAFQKVLSGETINNLEVVFVAKDGKLVPVEGNINCRFVNGKPFATQGIFRDITERKRAQEEVRRARDDYLKITNLTGDIIVKLDTEDRWTFVNDGACQFWGKPGRELIGSAFADYLHPDDQEITIAAVKQVKSNKLVKGLVNRQKTPKGWRTVEWNAAAIFDEEGRYIGFQSTGRDITERKRTEDELRESEQRLRTIFDSAMDGMLLVDTKTKKFTFGNKMICQMLGYSPEEIINLGVLDIHPKEDLPYVMEQFEKLARKEITLVKDVPVKRKDGSVFYADVNSCPITLGGNTHLLSIFRDITERKQSEKKIGHLNQLLRAVFNVSEFIAREKDSNILIQRVCDTLAESQIFRHAWVALLDEAKMPVATAEAGLGKDFLTLVKRWKLGKLPACGQKALQQSELVVSRESLSDCDGCPLADKHTSDSVLTIRLEYDGKAYGLLSCCTIDRYGLGEEEQGLLHRIAGDIAFALHAAEVENQRQRVVKDLVDLTKLI